MAHKESRWFASTDEQETFEAVLWIVVGPVALMLFVAVVVLLIALALQ